MINKDKVKGYICGIITAMILCSTAVFAQSIEKAVTAVYNNIKIVVNGTQITPTDANGNVVEPFIIDGTTYLPVRAVASALGQDVNWHGETNTVYIGTLPSDMQYSVDVQPLRTYTSTPLVSVGDIGINGSLYNINMTLGLSQDYLAQQCDNFSPFSTLQEMTINSVPAARKLTDDLTNAFHPIYAVYNELEKTGYLNDEKIKTGMESAWIEYSAQFGSEEEMKKVFESCAASVDDFKVFIKANTAFSLYSEYLKNDFAGKKYSLDEITDTVKKQYVKVKHILVNDEATALEVINGLNNGAKFDSLVEKYNLDSGQSPDGYTFTKGEMVPEFESASYSLAVNEYTKVPVKSTYGYHIIQRYDIDKEWISENKNTLSDAIADLKVTEIINGIVDKFPPVYTAEYEKYIADLK